MQINLDFDTHWIFYAFLVAVRSVVAVWLLNSLKRFLNINYECMMNDWNWKKRSPPFVPVSGWSSSLVMKKYSWFASLLALAYLFLLTSKSDVGLFCNNNKYTCYTCICIMIIKLHETLPNETLRMMTNTLYTKIIWFDYYRNDNKAVSFNQLVFKWVLKDKFSMIYKPFYKIWISNYNNTNHRY